MFRFADPWFLSLALLAVLPVLGAMWRERSGRGARVLYTDSGTLGAGAGSVRVRASKALPWMPSLAIALGAVSLARPQAGHRIEQVTTEGIDIVVALDVSGSMRAEDFAPKNRLNVAQRTIAAFIDGRSADRIGLVTFARYSETRCPPTLDYEALKTSLAGTAFALGNDDGTAIGGGIATAVNRLRTSKAKSRVVILLTDGINNAGTIDPQTAADLARAVGVRIHTIGVGSDGPVIVPLPDGRRVEALLPIDEDGLRKLAAVTGGSYFRATDGKALQEIFRKIDSMEKTRARVTSYGRYDELFFLALAPALALLALELALGSTVLRRVP